MKHRNVLIIVLVSLLQISFTSSADEKPATTTTEAVPEWTTPASISLVSDSIFRGQSQTWGRPALQFVIEADHKSGAYLGFAAANVSDQWIPGGNLETDFYGGYRGNFPGAASDVSYDVGGIYYYYPGANWDESGFNPPTCPSCNTKSNNLNTFEIYGSVSYKWLSLKAGRTLTEYWGWNNNNSGIGIGFANDLQAGVKPGGDTKGSYFYETNLTYELWPSWIVTGQLGRQVIHDVKGLNLTYYKAGVTKSFAGGWSIGVFYSGSNEPAAYKDFLGLRNTTSKSDIAKDTGYISITKSF